MFNDNPLLQQLKQQMRESIPQVEGVVRATDRGFGFLETDSQQSYFIAPPMMRKVVHGDRITALIRSDKDREQAEPDTLLEQGLTRFIGQLDLNKDQLYVQPDQPQIKQSFKSRPAKALAQETLNKGDWVVAELTRHPLRDKGFFAQITHKIADASDPFAPWKTTLARHQVDEKAPELTEAVTQPENQQRIDLCDLSFITIDGATTRDMDDALYIEKTDTGWELTVAIADPGSFIAPATPLDIEAAKRAFTLYLPGQNVPMLPRELSDDHCSLHQGERRAVFCCKMTIDASGSITTEPSFFEGWIESKARLNYDEVSDWLENPESAASPGDDAICQQLLMLDSCTLQRLAWRHENQVVFPDRPDYSFELDDQAEVIAIHAKYRRTAQRIVEEAMIAANSMAGHLLKNHDCQAFYNGHAGFNPDHFEQLTTLLQQSDLPLEPGQLEEPESFARVRRHLSQHPDQYLDLRLRRHQAPSLVSLSSTAHQAMGIESYATWTSPIRKYSDLVNQRQLKAIVNQQTPAKISAELADHISDRRRVQRQAEREVNDRLYCRYLQPHIEQGNTFEAEIFDINRAGIRVILKEIGAFAFIPAAQVSKSHKELKFCRDSGRLLHDDKELLRLGDPLQVQISKADEQSRNLLAKLASPIKVSHQKLEETEAV
ncbi:exoribonuclease II [Dongshaea marina]|uniref:exoribonuclease II n=1 Tax=Dongshaea marina TaxID=2047966 RepID=UPI000D3ED47D|nr:exoribonuclease II [Dongshaea marina]